MCYKVHEEVPQGPSSPHHSVTRGSLLSWCSAPEIQRSSPAPAGPSRDWRVLAASIHGLPHRCKEPQQHLLLVCLFTALWEPRIAGITSIRMHKKMFVQAEATQITLVSAAKVARRSSAASSSRDRACR